MNPDAMLQTARKLAEGEQPSQPSGWDLRLAVECAYFALFHAFCRRCADMWATNNPITPLEQETWLLVYRALDDDKVRRLRDKRDIAHCSPNMTKFADAIAEMERHRDDAVYNPAVEFTQPQVRQLIADTESTLEEFRKTPDQEVNALATVVLM